MRHVSAVLMTVFALRSIHLICSDLLIPLKFVRSDVGEVSTRFVARDFTFSSRTLDMLIDGFRAFGQLSRLLYVFKISIDLPVSFSSFSLHMAFKCESPLSKTFFLFGKRNFCATSVYFSSSSLRTFSLFFSSSTSFHFSINSSVNFILSFTSVWFSTVRSTFSASSFVIFFIVSRCISIHWWCDNCGFFFGMMFLLWVLTNDW